MSSEACCGNHLPSQLHHAALLPSSVSNTGASTHTSHQQDHQHAGVMRNRSDTDPQEYLDCGGHPGTDSDARHHQLPSIKKVQNPQPPRASVSTETGMRCHLLSETVGAKAELNMTVTRTGQIVQSEHDNLSFSKRVKRKRRTYGVFESGLYPGVSKFDIQLWQR